MTVRYKPAGGGGSPASVTVPWGPDFGESADSNTFTVTAAADLAAVGLAGNHAVNVTPTMTALALAGGQNVTAAVDLDSVALAGNHAVNVSLADSFTTSDILSPKDTWIPNVAGCIDNANKDATDLQLEGIIATRKDAYMAWDVSGLPSTSTVTAATLTVNVKTAPTVSADVTMNSIAAGDETWSETTLTCSVAKTLTASQTWTAPFATTGDKSVALNANLLAKLDARMGAGTFTVVLTGAATLTNTVLESADEGTNNASGPRLAITFTTP